MNEKLTSSINKHEKIKLFYKQRLIKLEEYEEMNLKILEEIMNKENRLNTVIQIGDYTMYIIYLINIAVNTYLSNITNQDNHIIKHLDFGDKVFFKGKVAEYLGIDETSSYGEGIKISFGYDDNTIVLKDFWYQILPYNGESNISKMSTRMSSKEFITKDIIRELLYSNDSEYKVKEFTGIIKNSSIIITPNKEFIENILKEITIEFKNKEYYFTELFPCAYITSGQTIQNLPGNYSKQEPLLYFGTNLGVGYEFIRANRDTDKVFIFGGYEVEKNFIDLENIISRNSIKQVNIVSNNKDILLLSDTIQNKEINNIHNNIYAWTEDALLNLSLQEYFNEENEFLKNQKELLDNYLEKTYEIQEINCENLSEMITESKICLSRILKSDLNETYKNRFIISGFGLVNTLETTPFPIEFLQENVEKLGLGITIPYRSLENLKDLQKEILVDDKMQNDINTLITNIECIIKMIYSKNPKFNKLLGQMNKYRFSKYYKKINTNIDTPVIIVRKKYEAIILDKYFKEQNINADVVSIDKYYINKTYEEAYVLGYFNFYKHNLLANNYLINTKFLLYKNEVIKLKKIRNKIKYLNKKLEKNNNLYDLLEIEYFEDENYKLDEVYIEEENIEEIREIEEYIEYNRFNIDFNKISYSGNYDIKTTVNAEKLLISENNEYALLTKKYSVKVIDLESKRVLKKKITEIKEGDLLLFVNEYLDEESNIVINIIEKLIKYNYLDNLTKDSQSIKAKYNLTKSWKVKLDNYREVNQLTYQELSSLFKLYNQEIHHVTIANWINNKRIIGPRNKDMYIAICKLIEDKNMENNVEEIYKASKDIRSLHTKIKNQIDRIIVNNYFNKNIKVNDSVTEVIINTMGNVSKYASAIQVAKITDYNKEVPMYMSNKLLDMDNIY